MDILGPIEAKVQAIKSDLFRKLNVWRHREEAIIALSLLITEDDPHAGMYKEFVSKLNELQVP